MSLLIKALEQAAKDRDAAKNEPAPVPAQSAAREPMSTSEAAARSAAPTTLSLETPVQRRPASSLAGLASIEAQQRARAAAVVQAGERAGGKLISYLRASPVAMLGALAAVFGIGFGIYVYLQIANPAMFARQSAPPPQPTAVQAPPPPPAAPVVASAAPAPDAPGAAAVPAPPATSPADARPSVSSAAAAGAIPGTAAGAGSPAGAPPGPAAGSGPIPTASVVGTGNAPDRTLPAARERASEAPREAPARRTAEPQKPAAAVTAVVDAPRERIVVSASTPKPTLNPSLTLAYSAMQSGDAEQARALYTRVIQTEPLNIDALLGLAYLAAQENRSDDAMKYYLRILQLDPRHALAQAATIGLMGRADPTAAEARLKQLIGREPSAFLHFVLGNLYADKSSWSQAQQAYFQAYHLEPQNPDYAYNLAVGLDHLRQSKLALDFYRRAEQLAAARGQANFNVSNARDRIASLSSQLE